MVPVCFIGLKRHKDISYRQQAFLLLNLLSFLRSQNPDKVLPKYVPKNNQNAQIYNSITELLAQGPTGRLLEEISWQLLNKNNNELCYEASFVTEVMKYLPKVFKMLLYTLDFNIKLPGSLLNLAITEDAFKSLTYILGFHGVLIYPVHAFLALENSNTEYAHLLLSHEKAPSFANVSAIQQGLLTAMQNGLRLDTDAILANCDKLAQGNPDSNMVTTLQTIKSIVRSADASLSRAKNSVLFTTPSASAEQRDVSFQNGSSLSN